MHAPEHALAYLHDRGISADAASRNKLRHLPADAIARGLWGPDPGRSVPADGWSIPYRTLDGKSEMLAMDGTPFIRYRVLDRRTKKDLPEGMSPIRYMASPNAGSRAYLPEGLLRLLDNGTDYLVITEGEIKALAAVEAGIPCIGIGGVSLWMAPETHNSGDDITPETPVHPEILELAKRVRKVAVLMDSDAKTKPDVKRDMGRLVEALRHQVPGCVVALARCKDPDAKGAKWGLDDWLVNAGLKSVEGMLRWYLREEQRREEARRSAGYKALGYDDRGYYVWDVSQGQQVHISREKIHNKPLLASLCTQEWCEAEYPKVTDQGITFDAEHLGGDMVAACKAAGPIRDDVVRGPGVWTHEDDQNVLVINSREVWRSDGVDIDRVGGEYVYPSVRDLRVRPDTPVATTSDVEVLLDCLKTWAWGRSSDPLLMLGWAGLGYVAGALRWRPHMSLTGDRGAGKSTLMHLLRQLLGAAAVYSEGESSEPGIRQHVRSSAPALLLDEGEADGVHLAKVLAFLRVASSGGTVLKGTSDQGGTKYTLRALGCVAGITPPAMQPADASRFLRLTIRKPEDDVVRTPHPLMDAYSGEAEALGLRLFARMIQRWPAFLAASRTLRSCMTGFEARAMDTLAPSIASAWVLLNDGDMTQEVAAEFLASIDLLDDIERIQAASDTDDLWSVLTTRAVQTSASGTSQRITIGQLIDLAAKDSGKGAFGRELGVYGIKLVAEGGKRFEICINHRSHEFVKLLEGSKYASADLSVALRRLPGADPKVSTKTTKIGGGSPVRYISIRTEIDPETAPAAPIDPSSLV